MGDCNDSKREILSEETSGTDAVGPPVSTCAGTSVHTCISRSSSGDSAHYSCVESSEKGSDDTDSRPAWLEFGAWLLHHQKPPGDSGQDEDSSIEVHVVEDSEQNDDLIEDLCPVNQKSTAGSKGPIVIQKDCRMESSLLSSSSGGPVQGLQEMSVMLGAPGIPALKCPIIPTKAIGTIMTALYEPLVAVEVGVLTRTLESPMHLKPRQHAGRGTLSLYILPDDSLSLTFEGRIENLDKKKSDVLDIFNHGMTNVQDIGYADAQASMWEELARFPRWREQSDKAVVTVHMLKGDKSGRSFYVMAGEGTHPPCFPLSCDSQKKFDEFRSATIAKESSTRRFYFWMCGGNTDEDIHSLGKIKSYIKHPPTLAKVAGVPQSVIDSLSTWAGHIDQRQQEQLRDKMNEGSPPMLTNPLDAVGAVLSRRVPSISTHSSFVDSECSLIESYTTAAANANAIFKDYKFDMSCPCSVTVSCALVLRGRVSSPGDKHEECAKEMSFASSSEGRCLSQELARKTVEDIGKIRVQEWICEDLVHKTRQQRLKIKAARQRKRDLERGYLALHAAGPMIQKAVMSANLGRKLHGEDKLDTAHLGRDLEERSSHSENSEEGGALDDASTKSVSQEIGSVVQNCQDEKKAEAQDDATSSSTSGPTKISIHDLNKLFGK